MKLAWRRSFSSLKLVSAIFFIKFLFFYQMIALQKLWKCFLFHLKSSFRSREIQIFCNFSLSFPRFPDSKGQMKVEWFMMSSTDMRKFADVIFVITQRLLHITSSNLVRCYITNRGIFLSLFRNLKSDLSLVPDPFYF